MKLTVEIKDSRLLYSYEIGEERSNSSTHLCADSLVVFVDLLRHLSTATKYYSNKFHDDLKAKAWVEQHPDEARAALNEVSK